MSAPESNSRRQFIKYGEAAVIGVGVASAIEIPVFTVATQNDKNTAAKKDAQITQMQSQASQSQQLQAQLISFQALRTLAVNESTEVQAIIQALAPLDSSSQNQTTVLYYVDTQLCGPYGNYAKGITYVPGASSIPASAPTYQYVIPLREFWRAGLADLEAYSNSAYGANFENLTVPQAAGVN